MYNSPLFIFVTLLATYLNVNNVSAMSTGVVSPTGPNGNQSRQCYACSGPGELCEVLYKPVTCTTPNNYCMNRVTNHADGTRFVQRGCANFGDCLNDWFLDTSDKDVCRHFDPNYVITLGFHCDFCCTTDLCNKNLKPVNLYVKT